MKATARDLRYETKRLLEAVERGESIVITYRGEPRAKLVPVEAETPTGRPREELFGLWKDRRDGDDVAAYVDDLRRSRSG
ncbi:MAG: type II toxin-antitoxin system prevent-host-death family antitoxin [Gemmatimonadota bacterium]